ncbi:hypothetical protein [Alkalibacterium olivapovliticus]|uniref:DUF2975 family protein n=1 Tax=Alkalibacterium olivapovliticus TaxID=99907 RepID=A0A2T0VT51_9LACT|nr:hypothetical protein [Alkalibacterium olivapovliticus]PRY74137.1 hypothetical protein CLV38_1462 [Alkalibacterium olivapovliticus]
MNVDRFRLICKLASLLLKAGAVFIAFTVMYSLFTYFFTDTNIWFNLNIPDFPFFNAVSGPLEDADMQLAALISVPFNFLLSFYIFWKGSELFQYLSGGHSPFAFKFAQSIKRLAIVMIVSDLLLPLFHSLLVTIIMDGRYYLIIGVGPSLMIGLILYAVSEVFTYGIELQRLSDETV